LSILLSLCVSHSSSVSFYRALKHSCRVHTHTHTHTHYTTLCILLVSHTSHC
jgi:hypothetical protein